ncbi:MAG: hypothetical protein K0S47_117 [Herbinix sp.]|jgi:hypothetical protein|nr:hypothetical protein [Herbinix sp.]
MIKKITNETINEYAMKIELAKKNILPMLPFVKLPFHDFDRYKYFSEKGIYLIDYLEDEYCLYHLYHLTEGDDTLRATLILPSNWEKRFEIMEKSIPNLKEWFLQEDQSGQFIIQSLEYGEIEYYPTLSHYLIPTIIRNGFKPKYRMYMKREAKALVTQEDVLEEGLCYVNYKKNMLPDIIDFYFHNEATKNNHYFTNCTYEEFLGLFEQDDTIRRSRFLKTDEEKIIAGIVVSEDSGKVWIDNFTVDPNYDDRNLGNYILSRVIKEFMTEQPEDTIYIYLNRDCRNAVDACEANGFVPFEFWTDMILKNNVNQQLEGG